MTQAQSIAAGASVQQPVLPYPAVDGAVSQAWSTLGGAGNSPQGQRALLVAHDLQTPLAAIRGHAQLLQRWLRQGRAIADAHLSEALTTIVQETEHMQRMIHELVVLRNSAHQAPSSAPTCLDLGTLARKVVGATGDPRIRLDVCDEPVEGDWDAERLERVMENLLSNACKYSAGDVSIEVTVSREDDEFERYALLSVRDHGIGIPVQDLPRLFEPFFRARNAGERATGSGLGLASVREIVSEHWGTVSVVSTEGYGSTFTIRLPCRSSSPVAMAPCERHP